MNSDTRTAYGSRVRRHGRSRPYSRYQRRRVERKAFSFVMSSEVETSLNISGNSKRLNSFVTRLSRRYPRGATVHVARPACSIPRLSVGMTRRCTRKVNSYTQLLTKDQASKLRSLLDELGFEFSAKQYTLFFAQKNKLSVAVYEKGPKVLVQGKGVEEFVQFELEPKILGEAKLGYEEVHAPEMFEPHFGVDESGKGDFFGPLVIAGVYVDRGIARRLIDAGVQDSKRISSDARIRALARSIRQVAGDLSDVVLIGPAKYNEL